MEISAIDHYFDQVYDDTYKEFCSYVVANVKVVDEAHDIMQNTYLSFYRRILNRGILPAQEAIKYLKASAKHEMGRHFKAKNRRQHTMSLDDEENYDAIMAEISPTDFEESVVDVDMTNTILNYVKSKDPLTYRIFILFYTVGLTMRETAYTLDISPSNAANRLYRTLSELRSLFGKKENVNDNTTQKGDDLNVTGRRFQESSI
ncbi:MAG: sigma-70 family RNA polymerase sigma factor [Clostridiales bacterium]|nr:sigma-70 family RNA polymerase sigma factor [Clostridiales bacterium]